MVMTRVVRRAGVPSALLVYSVERFGPVDAAPVLLIPCSCVVVHMLTFIDHIHRFLIIRRGVAPRGTRVAAPRCVARVRGKLSVSRMRRGMDHMEMDMRMRSHPPSRRLWRPSLVP